jgi:AcrR family transcriptional regulator
MTPKLKPETLEERKTQILNAAWTCFTRQGYNNTTMDDIVAESGLSKGTLYWHFNSKDALFEATVLAFVSEVGQEIFAALEQCETVTDKLRAAARGTVSFGRKAEGLFGLIVEFWARSDRREEVSRFWADVLVQYQEFFVGVIEEGIQKGEFKDVDAGHLAWVLMAAYDGLAAYLMLMPDLDLEAISESFVETLLSGIRLAESRIPESPSSESPDSQVPTSLPNESE